MRNIAVILGGCGTKDGSEINETVTLLLALDQHNIKYQCFAPDRDQYQVVNHLTGEVSEERRNMLVESARIVRGEILPLTDFNADEGPIYMGPFIFLGILLKNFCHDKIIITIFKVLNELFRI